ncbi:RNA polymerase sigma factor [Sulfitobacter sp. HNIBRBA2951]|uniref:RNA polymerase sigma factor n=1 Tax=Sulfitobacter aquimarinus TaxID=3158557 RepID=UPI0032E03BA2
MQIFDTPRTLDALTKKLRTRARRLGAGPTDAEDMVQETFLRLLQRMARSPVSEPHHYAMIILHNIARRKWRTHKDTDELDENSATTQPVAEGRLAVDALHRAIHSLPADQAQIMALVLEGEQSPKAIAKQLHLPEGTVMSRLARARARLRDQIGLDAYAPVTELL